MQFHDPLKNEKSKGIYSDSLINKDATTAIIFIAGIAGSRRYWDRVYQSLSFDYSLYFIDLLGFGFSAKPNIDYTLEKHIEAVKNFIDGYVKEKQIIFVCHSMGSIIALGYLDKYPKEVKKVFLFGLPYFHSEAEARKHIKEYAKPSFVVEDRLITKLACTFCCYMCGPITRRIGHFLLPDLPKDVASDGFLHTYNSYITTLYNVVYKQDVPSLITTASKKKIMLFHGIKDRIAPVKNVQELAETYKLKLMLFPDGAHKLPISEKENIINIIQQN